MEKGATRSRWLFLIVMVFAGVVAGGVLGSWAARNGYPVFTTGLLSPAFANNNVADPGQAPLLPDSFAPVIRPDLPGVVEVSAKMVLKQAVSGSPFQFNFPGFPQFSMPQQQGPITEHALGSGFVVRSDGIIVTNDHVVKDAKDIHVTTESGVEYKATVLGTDPQTDLAVLKIDAPDLVALPLGDSSHLRIGDIVFAIGNPLGLNETVTMGIISAEGRGQVEGGNPLSIQDFLQTDAAINHGNSGGPLIDTKGQVVGVDTAIATEGGQGNIGIGFAIPINIAKFVVNQIVAHGKVIRGQMGVGLQIGYTPDVAMALGLPRKEGALVSTVTAGGPAAKAGLKHGDIILKFNGQPVKDNTALILDVSSTPPGTTIHLDVFRDGKTFPVDVTLETRPSGMTANASYTPSGASTNSPLSGVNVQALTPDIASELKVPSGTQGVIVSSVDPNSPAAEYLQRGDIIEEVNRHSVASVEQFNSAVQAAGEKKVLLYVYFPNGNAGYVVIRPSNE